MLNFSSIKNYLTLVKFSHTVFALPFALSMYVVLLRDYGFSFSQFVWIIFALIFARTSAMAFNRILDRDIDAKNNRTKAREIPSGKVSLKSAIFLFVSSSLLFIYSSFNLGLNCFYLSPIVLFFLLFYSYTKRFTSSAHLFLGFALALAPGGVWFALTNTFSLKPMPLMFGVLFWVAGFDILYSCQDFSFDKNEKLHSIPSKFGLNNSFKIAKLFHVITVLLFVVFGLTFNLNFIYYLGLASFSYFLFSQYLLINPNSLEKIDTAFFNKNAFASIVFFSSVLLDVVLL